jgi:ligand-binding SRPBCC domain-containing protein
MFHENEGRVVMEDRVTYVVGFGPLGVVLNALWIERKLNQIFDYRVRRVEEIFAPQ